LGSAVSLLAYALILLNIPNEAPLGETEATAFIGRPRIFCHMPFLKGHDMEICQLFGTHVAHIVPLAAAPVSTLRPIRHIRPFPPSLYF
jgi:hypothetical protein